MIMKLFSGDQYSITKDQSEAIETAVLRGDKFFRVNGDLIASSAVQMIKAGGPTQAPKNKAIIDQPDFRGQPSPAKEELRRQLIAKGLPIKSDDVDNLT